MVERRVALVPTVVPARQLPDVRRRGGREVPGVRHPHARAPRPPTRHDHGGVRSGVAIYAGTDAGGVLPHGGIADEVLELAAYGFKPADALGAASWHARAWLGHDGTLAEGTSADFVVVPRDPLEDLTALREPTRVVLRGAVVA
jgi:imidazolonepropionase-like amidohydrolase